MIQCFNKKGKQKLDKDDIQRLKYLCDFAGGLAMKAHSFVNTLTVVVGMVQNVATSNHQINQIDSTPGLGCFQNMNLPIDQSKKLIT